MKKNEILVLYGKRIKEMAEEACRLADLRCLILEKCASPDARIALKPNLLGPVAAEDGATTHPEIVEGVLAYLKAEGFRNLAVMEGSWVGDRTEDSLLVTGMGDLLRGLDVPFIDLQKDRTCRIDCCGMSLTVCRSPLEADFLINLPVMKGHCQTRMTCALKNMKGCIPNSEKRRFHKMGLFDPIGHLSCGLHQDFILTDSICSDLTFEDGGNPVQQDRIFAAADPVLNDAYCCRLMELSLSDVPYIGIAEACGVGSSDLSGADIRIYREEKEGYIAGEESKPAASSMNLRDILSVKEIVNEVDSCSACYGTLLPVLRRLKDEGYETGRLRGLCIGQGFRGKKGKLGIGSCTASFDVHLLGCPPEEDAMYTFLREILQDSEKEILQDPEKEILQDS